MVSTTDVMKLSTLEQYVRELGEDFAIPNDRLNVDTYHEPRRDVDAIRVSFRTPHHGQKYHGEVTLDIDASYQSHLDLVERKLTTLLQDLEETWLEEGGQVTFYKNHAFFYYFAKKSESAVIEVQCTVCNHMEMVNGPSDELEKYRDVFLMKLLPKAHGKCDCAAGRYDSIDRPSLHGL